MHEEKVVSEELAQHSTAQLTGVSEEADDISEVIQYSIDYTAWIAI
jgi:hypothetical protein